jgi:hypothetical protein
MSEKHCTPRVKRQPLRQIEREIRAQKLFRWHCQQTYVECVVDGKRGFQMTARFSRPPLKPRGFRADPLWRPNGFAFQQRLGA